HFMKLNQLLSASFLVSALVVTPSFAGEGHSSMKHGQMMPQSTKHAQMSQSTESKMFVEKREIDGYTVSFHVMEAAEGMRHGGSHNLMIKVEQNNTVVSELTANSKVVYPDGKDESKALMKMGDWYMVGYDLKDHGKHQLMVLFKTADGKKHFGGVHYGH
ncbi:MAG: hypothetical protein OQJ91_10910, partial [Motiliproteus sp.]|nr:hypothetical protein [Motiliproteus sp.]